MSGISSFFMGLLVLFILRLTRYTTRKTIRKVKTTAVTPRVVPSATTLLFEAVKYNVEHVFMLHDDCE